MKSTKNEIIFLGRGGVAWTHDKASLAFERALPDDHEHEEEEEEVHDDRSSEEGGEGGSCYSETKSYQQQLVDQVRRLWSF